VLAERLGMVMVCEVCSGGGDLDGKACVCDAGRRLPTEAEVRKAIFEAGWTDVEVSCDEATWAHVVVLSVDSRRTAAAKRGVDGSDELVLLALLRALEVCRAAG
jgi:hypothetical protein